MTINSFQGKHRFLSNFYPAKIKLDDITYPTVEHAFQAAKTHDELHRYIICTAPTPGKAKRMGRHVILRPGWEEAKLSIMKQLVKQKFSEEPLLSLLLQTGNAELVEENTWGDKFWGKYLDEGKNHLGQILMEVRNTLATAIT